MSLTSAPPRRVAITAAGVVSPLGIGMAETLESLRTARDCIGPVKLFDASLCRCQTSGQVDDSRLALEFVHSARNPNRQLRRLHRASLMMIAATRQAMEADPGFQPERMLIGTTSGGMSFGEAFYRSMVSGNRSSRATGLPVTEGRNQGTGSSRNHRLFKAAWLANYAPQKPVLDALDAIGVSVPCQIIANACASGSNAIGHAFALIRNGVRKRVIAGGYDAISELVFVGFDSLQASTPDRCRPFDKARTGLVLGEGAAVFALEEMESALKRGVPLLGEVTGYGISTDNYHLTQPHPSGIGPLTAMQRALESAGLRPDQIDYINAHGTATAFNDATEGSAIAQLFAPHRPPVSSTKSLMGHALGAAGAIEAVISLLALQHDFMPPNANYLEPDPQWDLDIVANQPRFAPIRRVLSNSFGFGGTNASLILEKATR